MNPLKQETKNEKWRELELGYGFKRAVASERTDLTVKTTRRRYANIFGQVYDKTLIVMIVTEVGGDETEVGYGRVPAFANAPES